MKLSDYQKFCPSTAVYPAIASSLQAHYKRNPFYCGMGLVGEALEFEQAMLDAPSDCQAKELSDVLWYSAMLATECGWQLDDLLVHGQDVLAGRFSPADLVGHSFEGIHVIATSVLEPLKKLWRDGYSDKQWVALRDALAATIACIDEQACLMGSDGIEVIADISHAKLTRRQQKGTLHGSGSDR